MNHSLLRREAVIPPPPLSKRVIHLLSLMKLQFLVIGLSAAVATMWCGPIGFDAALAQKIGKVDQPALQHPTQESPSCILSFGDQLAVLRVLNVDPSTVDAVRCAVDGKTVEMTYTVRSQH
ncbi:MAG: hypothetical protein QY323_00250 [Patescibacteria group bacterium]|nr:MAG: hypothetical protein QY323_00250 [Patescibacteria group bacterium]